jgi:hypothetical protein
LMNLSRTTSANSALDDRALGFELDALELIEMPICSTPKHRNRYVPAATLPQQLAEIKILLDALRLLPIARPLKKGMLDWALWQVTFATGNTQKEFLGRWRSESVIRQVGLKTERDHVYQRKTLLEGLFSSSPDLDGIIARAQCCVVVTADEHRSLSRIDGGEKYRIAGITVYDMLYETKVVPELEWRA